MQSDGLEALNDFLENGGAGDELAKSKYIKREGTPGNYKYTYPDGTQGHSPDSKHHEVEASSMNRARASGGGTETDFQVRDPSKPGGQEFHKYRTQGATPGERKTAALKMHAEKHGITKQVKHVDLDKRAMHEKRELAPRLHEETHDEGTYHVEHHGAGAHAIMFKPKKGKHSRIVAYHNSLEGAKAGIAKRHADHGKPAFQPEHGKQYPLTGPNSIASGNPVAVGDEKHQELMDRGHAEAKHAATFGAQGDSEGHALAATHHNAAYEHFKGASLHTHGATKQKAEALAAHHDQQMKHHQEQEKIANKKESGPPASETTEKSMSGLDALQAFAKSEQALPTGEAGLESNAGNGIADGLEGLGKQSGNGSSSAGPAIGAPSVPEEKLSVDDDTVDTQLDEGPPKQLVKGQRYHTRHELEQSVAQQKAAKVAQLRKGEDDMEHAPGVRQAAPERQQLAKASTWDQGPDSLFKYNDSVDLMAEEMLKSDSMYQPGAVRSLAAPAQDRADEHPALQELRLADEPDAHVVPALRRRLQRSPAVEGHGPGHRHRRHAPRPGLAPRSR